MASNKKTNFVSYDIKKLEKYIQQLEAYLDANPPHQAEDRLDVRYNERTGSPIVKVIASKESIIKLFSETLAKLPQALEALNSLRRSVNEEEKTKEVRGDQSIPGFMQLEDHLSKVEDDNDYVDDHYREEKFDDGDEKLPLPTKLETAELVIMDFTKVELTPTVSEADWQEWEEDD